LECGEEQPKGSSCSSCAVDFAEYYCAVCSLYSAAPQGIFHCAKCGICRVGKESQYFHCDRCNACFTNSSKAGHVCVNNALESDCPICEWLNRSSFNVGTSILCLACSGLRVLNSLHENYCAI
jgi:hypothetical protein